MSQKVTLITGTRKGIGEALARHYLERGHFVFGCSRGAASIQHESYEHHCLDVTDEAAVAKMFDRVRSRFSRLDHLINNAAIGALNPALLMPVSQMKSIFATNMAAPFHLCQEAARIMHRSKFGRIVNMTSVMAADSTPGHVAYASSKAALESMTRVLAQEWGAYNITVNAVGPNSVSTDLLNSLPKEMIESSLAKQARPGVTSSASVAYGVDFFLGDLEGRFTGQTLYLGGVW